jgi:hypothetical protein
MLEFPMPEPRESMLAAFLAEAFAEDELRRWVHNHLGPTAYRDLPGKGTSLNEVAFQIALSISRCGYDEVLFESLLKERPGLAARIRTIAEHWSDADDRLEGQATPMQAVSRTPGASHSTVDFEFASIVLARTEPPWLVRPRRACSSPFEMPCLHHFQVQGSSRTSDLPLDVTVLNLASRPLALTHVGVDVVEICPSFAHLERDDSVWPSRGIPAAARIEKQDAYVIGAQELFALFRPHVIRVLRQRRIRVADSAAGVAGDAATSGTAPAGTSAAIITVGETLWNQLDCPVYLSAGAPYRFDLLVGFQPYFPGNMILRLAARTQLGIHYSDAIETSIEP